MRAGKTMRGRRDDEDDDRPLSPTGRGHTTRGERAGIFVDFSRAFLSSGVPERAPEGQGWRGLAGWMKAQIRGRDWADLRRPDEKNAYRRPRRTCEWRCSKLEFEEGSHPRWRRALSPPKVVREIS
jgi:hypothetical protein